MTTNNRSKAITPIGITDWRDVHRRFGIYDKDRLRHIFCIGKTGSGKSTMLLNMASSDIQRGLGCMVIDPHGDLAQELLHCIPQHRIRDVIYFNAVDSEYSIAFNPLANVEKHYHHVVASSLVSTLKKLFDSWGPRLEHTLRFSLLTLLEYGDATLLDLQPLLTNTAFRRKVLRKITSGHLIEFWNSELSGGQGFRADAVSPILNKLGLFAASDPLRRIFGQRRQTFSLRAAMDEQKIVIVNLAKGMLGEDACSFLGGVLISTLQYAALSRASIDESQRRPYVAYIDEVHSFITLSFVSILSEARKYGLSLFLVTQFLDQLNNELRAAIFGNVGTLISFRVGVLDAKLLAKEFYPVFDESDLIHLPKHSIYLKLMIDGETSKPFSAMTLPQLYQGQSYRKEIIEHSRGRYARPQGQVDATMRGGNRYADDSENDQPRLF